MNKSKLRPPLLLLPNVAVILLGACSVARADEDDPSSEVNWISPTPNQVFISGDKMVATWSASSKPIVSPSFQLCLVEMFECGDTVWPNVKKLPDGQYTITMKIPELGLDNEFFIRMEDDNGAVYDTPEFKLQAVPTNALSSNPSGLGPSPSGPPDSPTSSDPLNSSSSSSGSTGSGSSSESDPGSPGSSSGPSASGSDGHKSSPQTGNGNKESPMRVTGDGPKGSGSTTASFSVSGNGTLTAATNSASSTALTPSATSNTLIGTSGDNKPSTVAIVVPLALFAVALAGLIFSLRQRSKAKEARDQTQIQTQSNVGREEPALEKVTTRDSTSSGSSGGSGMTDLERAMAFIARVNAHESPTLTTLPPSIESKRRARRENRMRKAEESLRVEDEYSERATITTSSSTPSLQQPVRQDAPPSDSTHKVQASAPSIAPHQALHQPATYAIYQGTPAGPPHGPVMYQPPSIPSTEPPASTLIYASLAPGPGPRHTASQTVSNLPAAGFSPAGIPRPPGFVQQQGLAASASMPILETTNPGTQFPPAPTPPVVLAPVSLPAPVPNPVHVELPPAPAFPASLQVAQPQVAIYPPPQTVAQSQVPQCQPEYMQHVQSQPQPEHNPTVSSPIGPNIPYSTRPQPQPQVQVHGIQNPYEAVVRALRTPRLG